MEMRVRCLARRRRLRWWEVPGGRSRVKFGFCGFLFLLFGGCAVGVWICQWSCLGMQALGFALGAIEIGSLDHAGIGGRGLEG